MCGLQAVYYKKNTTKEANKNQFLIQLIGQSITCSVLRLAIL